jgi:hypothetical protein
MVFAGLFSALVKQVAVSTGPRTAKPVTANGDAQVDTSVKKFGTGSCLLDGTGDYLSISSADDADFSFTGDFTLEFWAYKTSNSVALQALLTNWKYGMWIGYSNSTTILCFFNDNSNSASATVSSTLNVWNHFAFVRSGTTVTIYVNGTASANTSTETGTIDMAADITAIGANTAQTAPNPPSVRDFFYGHFDEIRFSKVARYTSNFTPATTEFTNDINTVLLLHCNGSDGSTSFPDDNI